MKRSLPASLLFWLVLSAVAAADSYRVGPGDVLSLRVLEWQPLENRAVEWDALRVELPVDADGMIRVPFLGRIEARALSLTEVGDLVAAGLQERFALSEPLDAVVHVSTYRPVYISGAVRNPGDYPFRPGLTVAQLIAQAGGASAAQMATDIDLRDLLNRDGAMALLDQEGERLAVRRAMLQAAIDGRGQVALPAEPAQAAWSQDIVESENQLLRLRHQRMERDLATLNSQIQLLDNEIEALVGRSEALERLMEVAQREHENVQSLAARGLTAGARVAETERTVALTEAQLLEVSTAILRARQGITLAEAEKLALRDRELIQDTRELQRVEEELDRVLTSLATQQRVSLAETGLFVQGGFEDDLDLPAPIVTVKRAGQSETGRNTGAATILEPGDVVEVRLPRMGRPGMRQSRGVATQ